MDISRSNISPPALTPAAFQTLLALADEDRHGYGVMLEVERITRGAVRLAPGTLYRSIKQLLDVGLIEESATRPDPALDDERRRYYRITSDGRRAATAEARRLETLVEASRRKRLVPVVAAGRGGRR